MLKTNELRIGNLVKTNSGNILEVQEVSGTHLHAIGLKSEGFNYKQIAPIPLTEEWLLKFGINKYIDGLELVKNDTGYYVSVTNEYGSEQWYQAGYIKYVHQLQNLYFALTGEELTIK